VVGTASAVDRLRRERDEARREAGEERDQARQERDRLLGLVEATQKLLEDQSRQRKPKRSWWRFGGDGTAAALLIAVFLISGGTAWAVGFGAVGFGSGNISCGQWTESKEADGSLHKTREQWVLGYLSAYSRWVDR